MFAVLAPVLSVVKGLARALPRKTWVMIGAVVALAALFIWWGNERHTQGVEETDAKWQLASDKLAAEAARSADAATRREAPRIAAHAAQVAAEKEKIDEAIAEGRSPLDALFPAAGGVRDDSGSRPR